jgi:phosphatidylserine/phosphatidylglycerophosphate/cardiolipin synthase-like enzyme/uncharacterized membrane protein YdjX (TVP38/TMEM64 family)
MIDHAAATIVQPGRNCWREERADRFKCIQDAADYFQLARRAMLGAERTIFILGWDILSAADLAPGTAPADAPTRLGDLVTFVAHRNPHLRCYILIWDYGSLYTLERDPFSRWKFGWRTPRNVHFGFDDHHPVGGCHHQKIVVVDDQLAFCGGIDLTGHRWDTSAHRVDEPLRISPTGASYCPYHEVHAMMSGPTAAALGELARERWRAVGNAHMPPASSSPASDLWPRNVAPDFEHVKIAIARTMPASDAQPAIRECEALYTDSIARAERRIYIESQYFTNAVLANAIADRLKSPDGPEVIVVVPLKCEGWLERNTMGALRDNVCRDLIAADTHKRLRIVCPMASRSRDVATFVHSKVAIIDDVLLRIGSANFSRRSMGVDTECDVAIDAAGDRTACEGVERVFHRLLGEHLGMTDDDVRRGVAAAGSVGARIDERGVADRTLVRVQFAAEESGLPAAVRAAADPEEPIQLAPPVAELVPRADAVKAMSPLRTWILPLVILLAGIASVLISAHDARHFRRALDIGREAPAAFLVGVVAFVVANVVLIPVELMAIAAGVFFGVVEGSIVSLAGSLVAAGIGYVAGRSIGAAGLGRRMSRRAHRSGRQLGARGITGVIVLRLTSVASARSIDLLCGAGRVPILHYALGTALGLAPAIVVLSGLGALLRRVLVYPSLRNGLVTIGVAALIVLVAAGLRTILLTRQFASSIKGHRDRAEFG